MDRKGFTLVEILAAITILAIISIITATTITHFVKKSHNELNEIQKDNIKMSAKVWVSDNKDKLIDKDCISITLKDLQDSGYIDDDVYEFDNNSKLDGDSIYVNITRLDKSYYYEVTDAIDDKCEEYEVE